MKPLQLGTRQLTLVSLRLKKTVPRSVNYVLPIRTLNLARRPLPMPQGMVLSMAIYGLNKIRLRLLERMILAVMASMKNRVITAMALGQSRVSTTLPLCMKLVTRWVSVIHLIQAMIKQMGRMMICLWHKILCVTLS